MRRCLQTNRKDIITTEQICELMKVECSTIKKWTIEQNSGSVIMSRMPEYRRPKRMLEWDSPVRRRKGRPALKWKTYIGNIIIDIDLTAGNWEK